MQNYYVFDFTKQDLAKRLTELQVKTYRKAAEVCDQVIEVAKKFDGKVINARFEKALYETTQARFTIRPNRIYDTHTEEFKMYVSDLEKRWVKDNLEAEYSACSYITNDTIYLVNKYDMTAENSIIVNKRLVADRLIAEIEIEKADLIKRADETEAAMDKVPEWKDRIREIGKQIEELRKEIPSDIADYYGMEMPYVHVSSY